MDLHYLKLFHTVAAHLSFSKAAEELHISQPAVSMQIKKFEEELGLVLFEHIGRNIYLSEYGEILFFYTKKIIQLLSEAETALEAAKSEISGEIAIGATSAPGNYLLPKIIGLFKNSYPLVEVNVYLDDRVEELFTRISLNQIDFAVVGGEIPSDDHFNIETLYVDDVSLILSFYNPLAQQSKITTKMLKDERIIMYEKSTQLYKLVEKIAIELGLRLENSITLGSVDAIKQVVAANLGISFVPRIAIIRDVNLGLLKEVRIKGEQLNYPFSLVHHKQKYLTPAMKQMIKLITTEIKEWENQLENQS
jgi:DNA-binding transcriptional LysR family regulator